MNEKTVQSRALELRREYQREWRRKNKDKVKESNRLYWERKAKKEAIDFNSLPDMKEADDCNRLRKMTFHSSGIIHGVKYGEITKRNPFYALEDQEELFLALFKEPSHYEQLSATPRKKDICILSEIPSDHPIFLQTFIAPKDKYRRICINQGVYQFTALLEYQGIPDIGDLILQMCFSFSYKADYPPYSFMIWPAQCTDSN